MAEVEGIPTDMTRPSITDILIEKSAKMTRTHTKEEGILKKGRKYWQRERNCGGDMRIENKG